MTHQPLALARKLTEPTKGHPYGELELYARCSCGWVSEPLPKLATVHQVLTDHVSARRATR